MIATAEAATAEVATAEVATAEVATAEAVIVSGRGTRAALKMAGRLSTVLVVMEDPPAASAQVLAVTYPTYPTRQQEPVALSRQGAVRS